MQLLTAWMGARRQSNLFRVVIMNCFASLGDDEDLVVCFGFGYSLLLRFLGDQIKNLLKVFEAPEYYDLWGASDAMMHFAKMYIK